MSNLEVRKIPFEFEGAPFLWNPEQPRFSVLMNQVGFLAVGFERFICKTFREAESRISDDHVATEAKLFREQEGVHAAAHTKHAKALIAQHPGLQKALDQTVESYDRLYAENSLDYHLAYTGGLEAIFTPFFKMVLDNRASLFRGGDTRVASLFLWHFCEEIEHRSSALMVFNHVVGNSWYRFKNSRSFQAHTRGIAEMLTEEFKANVPGLPAEAFEGDPFASVSRMAKFRSAAGIFSSQLPWHNPKHQPLPDYYEEWIGEWNAGKDVTAIYGQPSS
ncbi:MAG: metal-dependent hydrolase [Myxococcota bacterium]